MHAKELPSPAVLRQLLKYEPDTGKLFWLPRERSWFSTERSYRIWLAQYCGKEAFTSTSTSTGYKQGNLLGRVMRAHRVVWAIHYVAWPENEIDHINGVRTDNRISNLRSVTRQTNARNISLSRRNTSGTIGVSWCRDRGKWYASIRANGKTVPLGRYDLLEDAIEARKAAEKEHGFHENHGRNE